jgi:hypothetical protein
LAAIAKEGHPILEAVMVGDPTRKNLSRMQGQAVNGLDEAYLVLIYNDQPKTGS